jgi:arylsulfatase A-like enzyme
MADQWRAEAFGYAGNRDVKTPNFDRLARESVWFANAVSTIPVCSPTRATILTGRRALAHGVFMNDVPLSPVAETFPKVFAAAGYDTGFIGKWHVDGHGRSAYIPPERRQGFQYWNALECTHDYNHSFYYGDGPEKKVWPGYDAESQTADAAAYLREHAHTERPFLLFLSWGPPHEPYQTAPERFRQVYKAENLSLRPNVPQEDAARARSELAGYYAHCTALDNCLLALRQTLVKTGLDENTIIVFTSDHGDMIWSHASEKKQQPFDESARVPLLLRLPMSLGGKRARLDATIGTEDIMPTLLSLCDLTVPTVVQGLDFTGHIRGGKDPSDGAAAILCPAPFGQWSRARGGREYRAIRTKRYTYARNLNGPWLLFDNKTDPYQMKNLVADPKHAGLQRRMDAWLTRKLKSRDDEFAPAETYFQRWGYKVDATGTVRYEN